MLKDPHELLQTIFCHPCDVIIDRTPVLEGDRDRMTVQHVPDHIYGGQYDIRPVPEPRKAMPPFSRRYSLFTD